MDSIELTLQEYWEEIIREGLYTKSLSASDHITTDSAGSIAIAPQRELFADDDEIEEPDTFVQRISTGDADRYDDVLDPLGCMFANYKRNPLFLWQHGMGPHGPLSDPNAVLGRVNAITRSPTELLAEAQYIPQESNPLVAQLLEQERKGLLPGNSIGWRPLGQITKRDGKRYIGKWELLEVSKVLVPVNGRATNRQLSR